MAMPRAFSVFMTACLVVVFLSACANQHGTPLTVDGDLRAAKRLTAIGKFDAAEAHLLNARGAHAPYGAEWQAITAHLAEVALERGTSDAACSYRAELVGGAEVVHLPARRGDWEPAGGRQRLLAEAADAAALGDHAAAFAALTAARKEMDPVCPAFATVSAAAMIEALRAGDMKGFAATGRELDGHFGDRRTVLRGAEDSAVFRVLVLYRVLMNRPLPVNTPSTMRDRLGFFTPE